MPNFNPMPPEVWKCKYTGREATILGGTTEWVRFALEQWEGGTEEIGLPLKTFLRDYRLPDPPIEQPGLFDEEEGDD